MSTFIINLNDTVALSDSTAMKLVKFMEPCQTCIQEAETNCQDVIIVAAICGVIVLTTLIVAVSLFIYFLIKNSKLRKQQEAERIKETEDKWFSLRKEYQGAILSILKSKGTPTQEESSEEKKANTEGVKDDSKEKYIEELRKCINWIDEQKSSI